VRPRRMSSAGEPGRCRCRLFPCREERSCREKAHGPRENRPGRTGRLRCLKASWPEELRKRGGSGALDYAEESGHMRALD
jgi:hypothetical protein